MVHPEQMNLKASILTGTLDFFFLSSTYREKSTLLSSDLVNSGGTLQVRESCSKNNWSKVTHCTSVFYYWRFAGITPVAPTCEASCTECLCPIHPTICIKNEK